VGGYTSAAPTVPTWLGRGRAKWLDVISYVAANLVFGKFDELHISTI
jgi:hypothetical protein